MRTIITGADGQLGQEIHKVLTERGFDILDIPYYPDFDITDHDAVPFLTEMHPELIIHCAAMTNVDACAKDPDEAFRVNAFGTQNVAHACLRCNAEMVYISTNEVFSGQNDRPYTENDQPQPINPYGSSKRAGEQMAAKYLPDGLYIVRTAWLYGGGNMFPEKILAAADKNGELKVVTDEISSPTYSVDLAKAVVQLTQTREYDTYHFVNAGYCSRYDYAKEILRLSGRGDVPIHPITLADYPRPSVVPPFAPLENSRGIRVGITFRSWQEALQEYFEQK